MIQFARVEECLDCCRLSFHVLYTPMQRSCAAVYGTAVPALGHGSLHNHTAKPLAFQVWRGVGGRCTGSEYPSKQPALLRVAHPAAAGRTPHRRICQSQPRQAARHWVWLLVQLVTHAFLWQFPDRRAETRANSVGVVLLPRFWRVPTVRSTPVACAPGPTGQRYPVQLVYYVGYPESKLRRLWHKSFFQ